MRCTHETIIWDADADGGFRTDPCGRTGVVARNGGLFCRLHDPERVRGGQAYSGTDVAPAAWSVVVAVDPAVTEDEHGIVVCGRRSSKTMLGADPPAGWLTPGHNDKEDGMSNAESLRLEAERLLERAAKIEALPKEPRKGRYYALEVRFRTSPTVYRYLIVRVKTRGLTDTWASTGRNVGTKYWEELVNWRDVESAKLTRLRKDKS